MKIYILYNARFFKIFKADANNQIIPTYTDTQADAMWYNDKSKDLFESAVRHICEYEQITPEQLEFINN